MRKMLAILGKQLYITYTDRNLLLIMLATPLMLATIFALVFGGFGNGSISDIPIAIVNLDSANNTGDIVDNGQIFVDILVPPQSTTSSDEQSQSTASATVLPEATAQPETSAANTGLTCAAASNDSGGGLGFTLYDLTDAELVTDVDTARAAVDSGDFTAAIIIPDDFSERINYTQEHPTVEPTTIEVYANNGSQITGGIVRSITQSLANQIATGNITIAATIDTLVARAQQNFAFGIAFAGSTETFAPNFACAFTPAFNPVQIDAQTVSGETVTFNPLVTLGSGITIFFMLFTAQGSANSLLEEQRNGTLQRMMVSPTSRLSIIVAQLGAGFVNCLVQITLLFIAFTVVGTLINGELTLIWGSNIPMIMLVLIAASLSVSGLGALLAGVARTPEAAATAGSIINIVLGLVGGAFFPVQSIPQIRPFSVISPVFWGTDAFTKLAQNVPDVWLNIVILLIQGLVMFIIGLWLFNRRLDV